MSTPDPTTLLTEWRNGNRSALEPRGRLFRRAVELHRVQPPAEHPYRVMAEAGLRGLGR